MKNITYISLFFFIFLSTLLEGQLAFDKTYPNIVPNASFEKFSGTPIGWFYKGAHFDNVIKYWNSPTGASPDIFGENIRVPTSWKDKGFGNIKAFHGKRLVGLTMYGCKEGKPHCREYIQIQLTEPLVVGQSYIVEYHVSHLPRAVSSNNIGIYFSEKQYEFQTEEQLSFSPQIHEENILNISSGNWRKVSKQFVAETEAAYLILGNFHTDDNTKIEKEVSTDLNFAYYYFDKISVRKIDPIINVPKKKDELFSLKMEAGKIFTLKNIFFDLNKADLLPISYKELQKLIRLMQNNPNLRIEIRGHTDNQGAPEYNQKLSLKRAEAVVDYLHSSGVINIQRLKSTGLGDTQPIASNNTLEGRQNNRRVEFRILGL